MKHMLTRALTCPPHPPMIGKVGQGQLPWMEKTLNRTALKSVICIVGLGDAETRQLQDDCSGEITGSIYDTLIIL